MKKRVKIPLIVVSSVVGAILIAVIIMCSIVIRPLQSFTDYSTVRITANTGNPPPDGTVTAQYKDKINKNFKSAGFSVMAATLEFVGSYGPKFETVKNDDGKEEIRNITIAQARNECAATEDSYKLELEFATTKTYTVGKSVVSYNRLMMNVKSTSGEIKWVNIYLYDYNMDGLQGSAEGDDYRVTPIKLRMNTSPLYIALGEILADF